MGDTGPFDVACRHRVVKISGCNEGLTVMIECGIDFEEKFVQYSVRHRVSQQVWLSVS